MNKPLVTKILDWMYHRDTPEPFARAASQPQPLRAWGELEDLNITIAKSRTSGSMSLGPVGGGITRW